MKEFNQLRKLMIADQIKRKVPTEIKEHFIGSWSSLIDLKILIKKLDN